MALLPCLHVQQRRERGQKQGNSLPRAIGVRGSEVRSLTKQSFSFLCVYFSSIYWAALKPYEHFDSRHPIKDAGTYIRALHRGKRDHKEFDHTGMWMLLCLLRKDPQALY